LDKKSDDYKAKLKEQQEKLKEERLAKQEAAK